MSASTSDSILTNDSFVSFNLGDRRRWSWMVIMCRQYEIGVFKPKRGFCAILKYGVVQLLGSIIYVYVLGRCGMAYITFWAVLGRSAMAYICPLQAYVFMEADFQIRILLFYTLS